MSEQEDEQTSVQRWDMDCADLDNAIDQAVRDERKATVAFLRGEHGPIRKTDADGDTLYREWEGPDFAAAIERGEHADQP